MKGSKVIIETLIKHGVNVSFGFPGGAVIPLFDAYLDYSDKIRNILVRHEQGAAHAAAAYARVSGKPGICIATSGPGATNLVTGIMDAYMDSVPVIAFGGQVPTSLIGNDAFQEADMIGITLPITKHNFQPRSPNELAPMIMKAFKIATEGRAGPVYIDLPKDTQAGEVTEPIPKEVHIEGFQPIVKGHPVQIKRAAELILDAERPLFLIGGGVIAADASDELRQLIELVKAPVTTTLMGKGAFPEEDALALGMLGMHGTKIANYAAIHADLLIAIGCRFSDRITGSLDSFAKKTKVIHIDIDPAEIGKNVHVDIPIVGNAKLIIKELVSELKKLSKKIKNTEWSKRIKELNDICQCNLDRDGKTINPMKVIFELKKVIRENDIVCTGVGQHQMFAAHFLKFKHPRTFISSGGAGTMGAGLPFAIGAKIAKPGVEVFDVDGDGSFQMTIQELGTSKEECIKVNPVIFNNEYLGMVRQWLELFFDKRYSQVHIKKTPNFEKIANAYSLEGITVTRPSEIHEALKRAIKNDETTIVDVHIEPESNILPMLPPGGHLSDAFGGCMLSKGRFFEKEPYLRG